MSLESLPYGSPVADVVRFVHRDGAVILRDVLNAEQLTEINAELDGPMEATRCGSAKENVDYQAFHGYRTKRLTNTISRSRVAREDFIGNPVTLGYVTELFKDVCDTFWLQSSQTIEIHPGEKVQPLHRDMDNYPVFRRYGAEKAPEVTVNYLLALVDSTEAAGATRVIPGSNKWPFEERGKPQMTIAAELEAGSALLMSGKTIHGGGANITTNVKRRVLSAGFNPGFLMPEDAHPFSVPLELARTMSPALQQITGFRSFHQFRQHGGSLWQYDFEELADHLKL
jgi:ectoine hydroxylase-related dioxygenase (phytanoyl-CoA dioxygenase family)